MIGVFVWARNEPSVDVRLTTCMKLTRLEYLFEAAMHNPSWGWILSLWIFLDVLVF